MSLWLALAATLLVAAPARADWTWNIGYQNPAVSTVGFNLLYLGSPWGFEVGLGWIDLARDKEDDADKDKDEDGEDDDRDDHSVNARLALAGDADVKYFFASGGARPFLQGGVGIGIGAGTGKYAGAGAGAGGLFAGAGILAGSPSLYLYGSYNVTSSLSDGFVQAGVGFDL